MKFSPVGALIGAVGLMDCSRSHLDELHMNNVSISRGIVNITSSYNGKWKNDLSGLNHYETVGYVDKCGEPDPDTRYIPSVTVTKSPDNIKNTIFVTTLRCAKMFEHDTGHVTTVGGEIDWSKVCLNVRASSVVGIQLLLATRPGDLNTVGSLCGLGNRAKG